MFIEFKVILTGSGVVNFDSKDGIPKEFQDSKFENVKYAKVNITKDLDDKKTREEIFISPQCLKNAIFQVPSGASLALFPKKRRNALYANPSYLLKGWMNAEEGMNFKRKSPLIITQAREYGGAVPHLEVGTTAGVRDSTSLFFAESVGETSYSTTIFLDLRELAFIPLDVTTDRLSLSDEIVNSPEFAAEYKKQYGEELPAPSVYVRANDPSETVEKGILMSDEVVNKIAQHFFFALSRLSISRAYAYANVSVVKATIKGDLKDIGSSWNGLSPIKLDASYLPSSDKAEWEARHELLTKQNVAKSDKKSKK